MVSRSWVHWFYLHTSAPARGASLDGILGVRVEDDQCRSLEVILGELALQGFVRLGWAFRRWNGPGSSPAVRSCTRLMGRLAAWRSIGDRYAVRYAERTW